MRGSQDRESLRGGAAKSDAPAYSEPYVSAADGSTQRAGNVPRATDSFRRMEEVAANAQRGAQSFLERVHASDPSALRYYLGIAYLLNCVLIAGSAVMVFFEEMLTLRGVLVGSVTSVVLVISLVMIAQERGVQTLRIAPLAEKYCLLLATAPGRAALVIVLGMLVVSCNWLGWLAFWASLFNGACLIYVWQTHPFFVENADNPLLFLSPDTNEPPVTARPSSREVAD